MNVCDKACEHCQTVDRAKRTMPSENAVDEVSAIFKCMAEPSRLKILLSLRQGELCVLHIVEAVGGTQSAVSHQLRILRDNRIIKARREGQNIVYSLADEHVIALLELAFAHLNCAF